MNFNIHDKNGNLTEYGFACGYVQSEQLGRNKKELYKEHNTYHVRMFRGEERVIWLSYEKLSEARKEYKSTSLTAPTIAQ